MPLQPMPASSADDLDIVEPICAVFRRKLKAEGLKYTPERARVLDAVVREEGLFEVEKILDEVNQAGIRVSKATVYRTFKLLQEAGIVQRVLFEQDQSLYQCIYGRKPADLIIRLDTREVIQVQSPELAGLRDRLCRERGLEPRGHRLHIFAVAKK